VVTAASTLGIVLIAWAAVLGLFVAALVLFTRRRRSTEHSDLSEAERRVSDGERRAGEERRRGLPDDRPHRVERRQSVMDRRSGLTDRRGAGDRLAF
jgi:hypothetical protein